MPRPAIHAQVAAGLQVVIHLERHSGVRVVDSVSVLLRNAEGSVFTECALAYSQSGTVAGPALPHLRRLMGVA